LGTGMFHIHWFCKIRAILVHD